MICEKCCFRMFRSSGRFFPKRNFFRENQHFRFFSPTSYFSVIVIVEVLSHDQKFLKWEPFLEKQLEDNLFSEYNKISTINR